MSSATSDMAGEYSFTSFGINNAGFTLVLNSRHWGPSLKYIISIEFNLRIMIIKNHIHRYVNYFLLHLGSFCIQMNINYS